MQELLGFLFHGSVVARVATAITVGVLLGFIVDFSVRLVAAPAVAASWSHTPSGGGVPESVIVCTVLGALAGVAAAGGQGGIVGLFWGWLIGGITDTLASEGASDSADKIPVRVLSWFITCLIGWGVGWTCSQLFEKYGARAPRFRRFVIGVFITVTVASFAVVLLRLAAWSRTVGG